MCKKIWWISIPVVSPSLPSQACLLPRLKCTQHVIFAFSLFQIIIFIVAGTHRNLQNKLWHKPESFKWFSSICNSDRSQLHHQTGWQISGDKSDWWWYQGNHRVVKRGENWWKGTISLICLFFQKLRVTKDKSCIFFFARLVLRDREHM